MVHLNSRRFLGALAIVLSLSAVSAGTSYAITPALSSRPGATYTLYLDFNGFSYTGNWGGGTPGTTPSYNDTAQVQEIWARTAEKYSSFNINVTTVDPAIAAGRNASDADRQSYYDQTARLMHTVIGGSGTWSGGGGVSFVGTTKTNYAGTNSGTTNGYHTNWVFPGALGPNYAPFISEATGHENGHGLGLNHQNDVSGTSDYSDNNKASGNGSYAPIMGASYSAQRGTWSVGTINKSTTQTQNDVSVIVTQNPGMSIIDDTIGHSFAAATALPLTGTSVDSTRANGIITPLASAGYNPIGIDNYTKDYFKFSVGTTGAVSLTVTNGGDWLTPGVVDPGMTLRSRLNIFGSGNLLTPLFVGTENAATTAVTFAGTLAAGDYYAQITSYGGNQSTFDTQRRFYDMGSYVLSGSGITPVVIPEPTTIGLLALGMVGFVIKRRKK